MKLLVVMAVMAAVVLGSPQVSYDIPEGLTMQQIVENILSQMNNENEHPEFDREAILEKLNSLPKPQKPAFLNRERRHIPENMPEFDLEAVQEKIQAFVDTMKEKIENMPKPNFEEAPKTHEEYVAMMKEHQQMFHDKVQAHIESMKEKVQAHQKPHFELPAVEEPARGKRMARPEFDRDAIYDKIQQHQAANADKIHAMQKPHFELPKAPEDMDREAILAHQQMVHDKIKEHLEAVKDKIQAHQKPSFELPALDAPAPARRIAKPHFQLPEAPEDFDHEAVFEQIKQHHQTMFDKIKEKVESLKKPDPEIAHYRPAFNDRMEPVLTPYKAPAAPQMPFLPHQLTEEQMEAIKDILHNLPKPDSPAFKPTNPIREGNFEALMPARN